MRNKDFEKFKKKAQHPKDELLTILTLDPISIRLAYLINKKKLKITPNAITKIRLFLFGPLAILSLILAPLLNNASFYLVCAILVYAMNLSDDLDGNLARGLNKTSKLGAFLDTIADRFLIIITITTIFSIGFWVQSRLLIFSSILIFVLKTFHMMVITKIYYYAEDKKYGEGEIFEGESASKRLGIAFIINTLRKINDKIKIKRWRVGIGGYERAFLTIILPCLLIYFGILNYAILLEALLAIFFILFFSIRIKNLLGTLFIRV